MFFDRKNGENPDKIGVFCGCIYFMQPFCVATKKLIENEPTSKQQFLGWIFDFCGVSHSKNGVSAVEWGVPLRKSGVSEKISREFRFEVALSAPSPKQ